VRDTVTVEELKKPVAVAITAEFVEHGKNIANIEGHPNIRQLVFPYPFEGLPEDQVRRHAREMYPTFLKSLGAKP
jgi:hypothetical protein